MTRATEPLHHKYTVRRVDFRDAPGARHEDCFLFVLDVTHDAAARVALGAYITACEAERPQLAADLRRTLRETVTEDNGGSR